MKKILGIIMFLFVLLVAGSVIYNLYYINGKEEIKNNNQNTSHDGIYVIDEKIINLENGVSEIEIVPGSASKIITRYFGNDVVGDFDGDGRDDSIFLLTQETGGSGIFYYVVARLNTEKGPVGSKGLFLGDRIAPQNINRGEGNIVVVNYAIRNEGENFDVRPSLGKSIWLLLDKETMTFGEVVQNFEGEANPEMMKLNMKTWNWINTKYNNDTQIKPKTSGKFSITFKNDNTFSASTDCNGIGGEYTVKDNKISFNKMMSTMMYCEGSQEQDFAKMLEQTDSYFFTSKGELVLELKLDTGSFIFK